MVVVETNPVGKEPFRNLNHLKIHIDSQKTSLLICCYISMHGRNNAWITFLFCCKRGHINKWRSQGQRLTATIFALLFLYISRLCYRWTQWWLSCAAIKTIFNFFDAWTHATHHHQIRFCLVWGQLSHRKPPNPQVNKKKHKNNMLNFH